MPNTTQSTKQSALKDTTQLAITLKLLGFSTQESFIFANDKCILYIDNRETRIIGKRFVANELLIAYLEENNLL